MNLTWQAVIDMPQIKEKNGLTGYKFNLVGSFSTKNFTGKGSMKYVLSCLTSCFLAPQSAPKSGFSNGVFLAFYLIVTYSSVANRPIPVYRLL